MQCSSVPEPCVEIQSTDQVVYHIDEGFHNRLT